MKTVSDEIGEDYKTWECGDIIFITAPTGTGKSYFILYELLGYMIDNNFSTKLLYLVNRTILKKQIESEINNKIQYRIQDKLQKLQKSIEDFIEVKTYQSIEHMLEKDNARFDNYPLSTIFHNSFSFVVYDECHYFSLDSTFNTLTELSYDFLRNTFFQNVQIFLSATMQNIKQQLISRQGFVNQNFKIIKDDNAIMMHLYKYAFNKINIKEYTVPADYSDINVQVIEDKDSLKKIIFENNQRKKEKWLIFTDNIEQGKELQIDLCSAMTKNDDMVQDENIVFIDAKFKEDELAQETVKQISNKSYSSAKIIISTCVMDNGISIKDENLRNLVIMADNEESFMQMLGRKRFMNKDNEPLTLFILKRDKKYFNNRIMHIEKILDFYKYNKNYVNYFVSKSCFYTKCINYFNGCNDLLCKNYNTSNFICLFEEYKKIINTQQPYVLNYFGVLPDYPKQIKLASNMIENPSIAESIIYLYGNAFHINSFAVNRYKFLIGYYSEISEQLEIDDNAFVKRQLSWIGKDFDDDQTNNLFFDEVEICKDSLIEKINMIVDTELSKKENLDLKKDIKKDIDILLNIYKSDNENISKYIKYFSDKNSTISKDTFNNIMEILKLDYHMDSPTPGKYIINRK